MSYSLTESLHDEVEVKVLPYKVSEEGCDHERYKFDVASVNTLEGLWHITLTTFPMWLEKKKYSPSLTYGAKFDHGTFEGYTDLVQYKDKHGETEEIKGFDTLIEPREGLRVTRALLENCALSFKWRGVGIEKLISSRWRFVCFGKDDQWAIISFESTLFTPAGFDVVARATNLTPAQHADVNVALANFGIPPEDLQPVQVLP
mmetsp:Transcript_23225/g.65210  ORF Transcript_23225/g.65210 Transcript_23225/m.65210 type:complete len:203 (-) Transcript_23225:105-713(-)